MYDVLYFYEKCNSKRNLYKFKKSQKLTARLNNLFLDKKFKKII